MPDGRRLRSHGGSRLALAIGCAWLCGGVGAAGCAQVLGIDQPNEVAPADAGVDSTAFDASADGDAAAAAETAPEAAPGDGAERDSADAAAPADASDASDASAADVTDSEALDAPDTGDAAEACAPPSALFPYTGSLYCPFGPDASTLSCASTTQECCIGGSTGGGTFADSLCTSLGSTCTNGTGAKQVECESTQDCGDAGAACCVQLNAPSSDGCGNLKGGLLHTLCEPTCAAGEARICASPVECASGTQCLPIRATGVSFGYCASSVFSVTPPTASFVVAAGGKSADTTFVIQNDSTSSQLVTVVLAGASSPFVIDTDGCTKAVPASLSCNVSVSFAPTAVGPVKGTLVVIAGGAPVATAVLTGTGQ